MIFKTLIQSEKRAFRQKIFTKTFLILLVIVLVIKSTPIYISTIYTIFAMPFFFDVYLFFLFQCTVFLFLFLILKFSIFICVCKFLELFFCDSTLIKQVPINFYFYAFLILMTFPTLSIFQILHISLLLFTSPKN